MANYMNRRMENMAVFQDTQEWYESDATLKNAIMNTLQRTKFYEPGSIKLPEKLYSRYEQPAEVFVTSCRTLEAAGLWKENQKDSRICILNFASATNPGGGVRNGSSAQEESLCRCSTLYPCLTAEGLFRKYYLFHRERRDQTYTDACIYSPDVLGIKSDTDRPQRLPEKEYIHVDVITCAAPNLREKPYNAMNPGTGDVAKLTDEEIYQLHMNRGKKIMDVALDNGDDIVVLGAFGCGAFCNPPAVVARAYNDILPQYANAFKAIEFAVYCPPHDKGNYNTFKRIIGKENR